MTIKNIVYLFVFAVFIFLANQICAENIINSDKDYSVIIAVTINQDDHIMGKLAYNNHDAQYPLQLVTFNPIGGVINAEPYVFELLEKTIVSENVHKIKCRPLNDKYGSPEITGVIDFNNELKPIVNLVNAAGHSYISNITEKGKEIHKKYIPNVWLGN